MAKRQASQFINTVIYQVDKNSLKKVRDTNKKLQKEFEKMKPPSFDRPSRGTGGGGGRGKSQKQDMDSHLRVREKHIRKTLRMEEIERGRAAKRREKIDIFIEDKLGGVHKNRRDAIRQDLLREKSTLRLNQAMRNVVKKEKERTAQLRKQNALSKRMSGSAMQLAGGFVSAFAAVEALTMITQTGMQFEAVGKAMLVSSKNAAEAKQHLTWVREEAMRLGTPLLSAQKGFSSLMAAAGDKVALEDLKTIFVGVSEASTALGLSADDQAGTILALKQMMSKGKIQADELTQQLGERLPFAMRAMSAAAVEAGIIDGSKTSQEREAALFKLMEQGKLLSADILPAFGRQLSLLANENDGLALALDHNLSPAIGRAQNHFAEMQKAFFEGGWKDGLLFITNNFNDQADAIKGIFSALGSFVQNILDITVGKIQLISAVLMDMANIISNPDFTILDKAKEAAKLMATGVKEAFAASPIGVQFEVWKGAASSVVGSDVNPLQWATGNRGQAPYANGQAPWQGATPYQPSSTMGSKAPTNNSPIKMEVTLKGGDGLIEVMDARVEDGIQGQLNSVLSVTGEQ